MPDKKQENSENDFIEDPAEDIQNCLKTLKKAKNKGLGLSIKEIAEKLNMFPSDVESVIKELQLLGAVECRWSEGELYVIFLKEIDLPNSSNSPDENPEDNESMYQ